MRAKLIAAVVLVIIMVLFAAKNANPTSFWFFRTFHPNLSILLLSSLIVGIVVGLLIAKVGKKAEKKAEEPS